jgi:acetylglutamate kinase
MVLNKINKDLVSMMQQVGLKAVGISGKDDALLQVERKLSNGQDIGFVGDVKQVNTELIDTLLDNDFIPVICPVGTGDGHESYNVNADDAACAVAKALKAAKLVFLTDIEGVYRDPQDRSSLISELSVPEAREFLKSGNVGGGMLPKLENCISAIEAGVSRVHILDGRIEHSLLLEFFTNRGIGTAIIGDQEERFYTEE